MRKKIVIGNRSIGGNSPVFVIAEIGCNFEKSLPRAKELIRKAASCGADAVKFQTFVAEKITTKSAPKFWEVKGCIGKTQYEEFKEMPNLNFDEYAQLKAVADKSGIIFFSTPEDEDSADMLEKLGVPLFKISSMNITHLPLLRHIARKKKPLIISTGASTIAEIKEAIRVVKQEGNEQICILHCISNYPTKDENVNLLMIAGLKKTFPELPVGYSDHTLPDNGEGIITAAVALGAKIIEKHFTFDNKRPGYDHEISADYESFKKIITQVRRVEKALGKKNKKPIDAEAKARIHGRRSIVAGRGIARGAAISREMLEIKRPATGIEPKFIDSIIGKKVNKNIKEDQVINWDMIAGNK